MYSETQQKEDTFEGAFFLLVAILESQMTVNPIAN